MVSPLPCRGSAAASLMLSWLWVAAVAPASAHAQEKTDGDRPRPTLRAKPIDRPPVLDGRLDEPEWADAERADSFVQSEPVEGRPLTEATIVRVLYDRDNLYVGVRCLDGEPDKIVINELVRDFDSREGDAFGIAIDPFMDRRSSFAFFFNAGGAQRDAQAFSDGRYSSLQWDGIWWAVGRVDEEGWSGEAAIPFKTLGVKSADVAEMGINFKRRIRRKNEEGYWSFVPRRFSINYQSNAGTLTGLGRVATGGNLRVKPFASGDARFGDAPAAADSFSPKGGVDLKYRVSEGLALDVTVNTDFSQVEVDQQQINLTRFNLFFPEKRDFFLENAGIFTLGDVPNQRSSNRRNEETQLFYSRRIGLSPKGEPLPLDGGVRLSGRTGPWSLGLMNIQQRASGDYESNNFTVARVQHDVLAHGDLGGMLVYRKGGAEGDYNLAWGGDFNARISDRLLVNAYGAATRTPGVEGARHAAQLAVAWEDSFYEALVLAADIGEGFDPQVGFVPRTGVRNYQVNFGVQARPEGLPLVRQFRPHTNVKFFVDRDGQLQTRDEHYALETSFHTGGRMEISINPQYERLTEPFKLPNGVQIPVGEYDFMEYRLALASDASQLVSGTLNVEGGGYYDGHRLRVAAATTILAKPRFTTELRYEYNKVDAEAGRYRADLFSLRARYSFSPRAFVDAYVQHNTSNDVTLTNLRFTWTYRPLSDFIVVYTDTRGATSQDSWSALVFKLTRLFQF